MCHVQLVLFTTKRTKRSLLRALRVLRGENIFTANPKEPNNLAMAADADLAADDMRDQGDDDDDERRQKRDHGAAFELAAERIIERQQRHRARLARTQQHHGADVARRRDKAEQADDDERRRQKRNQYLPIALEPSAAGNPRRLFEFGP